MSIWAIALAAFLLFVWPALFVSGHALLEVSDAVDIKALRMYLQIMIIAAHLFAAVGGAMFFVEKLAP